MRVPDHRINPTPEEFERIVLDMLARDGAELHDVSVQHHERLRGHGGSYVFDITCRFVAFGVEFLLLVECKSGQSPVKREVIESLNQRMIAVAAQKGMLVAIADFQKGAVELARHHRIAVVQVKDGSAKYILKAKGAKDLLRDGYSAWLISPCPDDDNAMSESLLDESDDRSASQFLFDAWGEKLR